MALTDVHYNRPLHRMAEYGMQHQHSSREEACCTACLYVQSSITLSGLMHSLSVSFSCIHKKGIRAEVNSNEAVSVRKTCKTALHVLQTDSCNLVMRLVALSVPHMWNCHMLAVPCYQMPHVKMQPVLRCQRTIAG